MHEALEHELLLQTMEGIAVMNLVAQVLGRGTPKYCSKPWMRHQFEVELSHRHAHRVGSINVQCPCQCQGTDCVKYSHNHQDCVSPHQVELRLDAYQHQWYDLAADTMALGITLNALIH